MMAIRFETVHCASPESSFSSFCSATSEFVVFGGALLVDVFFGGLESNSDEIKAIQGLSVGGYIGNLSPMSHPNVHSIRIP